MKLTTESSAFLYAYLPATSNIPLTTLFSQTNMCCDLNHQISRPHKMTGTMTALKMIKCNILNWMAASIAWTQSALFSKIMVLLKFRQDLKYLRPDKRQSDSGASQAMWRTIRTAQDVTIRSAQNPSSTVQLLHEFRLTEKQKNSEYLLNVNNTTKTHKRKSGSVVITWSPIGSWISFSATSVTCDILSFKTTHLISTMNRW